MTTPLRWKQLPPTRLFKCSCLRPLVRSCFRWMNPKYCLILSSSAFINSFWRFSVIDVACCCCAANGLQPMVRHQCHSHCSLYNPSVSAADIRMHCCCGLSWLMRFYRATDPMENLHSALISSSSHPSFKQVAPIITAATFTYLLLHL